MQITFIGGGNMAAALAGGLAARGFDPTRIKVVEVLHEARNRLSETLGVATFASPAEAAPFGDLIVLAVKPQQMRDAAAALQPHLRGEPVLSIAAGLRTTDLARWLGEGVHLLRCMPNTPSLIGCGVAALYAAPGVTEGERKAAQTVLEAVGKAVWVDDEALLDPVTAVSGSGPAYVFYFIEALEEAARTLGLPDAVGRELAIETMRGAAELAARSPESAATLRERVTSKGGTTERALASMTDDRVKEAIVRAVQAASARGRELGDLLGKD
jgi:pyrroline-5-carboxylate reductase